MSDFNNFNHCCECVYFDICDFSESADDVACGHFKDAAKFVELITATQIRHTPDAEIMSAFHSQGFGQAMSVDSIYWTCSNCGMWTSLAYKYCPNCGAKFQSN